MDEHSGEDKELNMDEHSGEDKEPQVYCTGLTTGEARTLIAQLAGGIPAGNVGGWTLIYEDSDRGLGILSSALIHDAGEPLIEEVLFMLVDAARSIVGQMRQDGEAS